VTADRDRFPTWVYLAALVTISLVSRLPQLLSPNLLLDGDECILGLMAKHVAEGKELPVFFYGQNYGLASIEAAAGALGFVISGTGPLTLKLAMLGLWSVGIVFYFLAFSELVGKRRSFWITSVLVLMPAWAVWSMKARGGYITSFTTTGALLFLLLRSTRMQTSARWFLAGCLTGVIYLAQPLWLPGVIPILLFSLLSHRKLSSACMYLLGAAPITIVGMGAATSGGARWEPSGIGNPDVLGSVPAVVQQIYVNLTGSYYLRFSFEPPGPISKILAYLWFAVLAATVVLQVYRLACKRYLLWTHLLFASMSATLLAAWLLFDARDGRYLLPLSALLVLLAGVEFFDLVDRKAYTGWGPSAAIASVLLLGALSLIEFREFSYMWTNPGNSQSETARLKRVVNYMKAKGVTHAFSIHALLQWQVMFYSDEQIISRSTSDVDRYPAYVSEMDRALADGETVAVVGYVGGRGGLENLVSREAIFTVDDRYVVYVGADRALLEKLHFQLPN